jgi:hypothetical protein
MKKTLKNCGLPKTGTTVHPQNEPNKTTEAHFRTRIDASRRIPIDGRESLRPEQNYLPIENPISFSPSTPSRPFRRLPPESEGSADR